jgi:hypothetical protein
MRDSLFRWATAVGAIPRIVAYRRRLAPLSYFERVRFCNSVLGPDWIFRLQDIVGQEVIEEARPSWLSFYRDDIYGQHLPLDPRAPETDEYLGSEMGAMEFAFYAGMGFEGYMLALNTIRQIDTENATVTLGGYRLSGVDTTKLMALKDQDLKASDYYAAYGRALTALFKLYETTESNVQLTDEGQLESAAAASLLFLCGGHQGCGSHKDRSEGQSVRQQVIILCRYVEALSKGEITLQSELSLVRAA